ncbi:hypothetical protein RhiirB3_530425 [Rhizophagus irregularis]|nr:hypothetical protein RhiirB3_530425 [Rhizophagus irregularis]
MSKQLALTVNQINIDDDDPALDVDINVLQQYASCRLNRHCICARRLTRGLYNEIYLLQFENGPDCIARLSRELTHPASKFASEVATMKYVTQNTNIKVPAVYDWNVWDELTIEQKKCVLSQIVDILFEL